MEIKTRNRHTILVNLNLIKESLLSKLLALKSVTNLRNFKK